MSAGSKEGTSLESRIFFEALDAWGTNLSTRAMVAWGDLSPLARICRNPLLGLACVLEGLMSFEQKATLLQQSCKTTLLLRRPLDHFLYRWKYTSPCSYPMASWLPTQGARAILALLGERAMNSKPCGVQTNTGLPLFLGFWFCAEPVLRVKTFHYS